MTGGPSRWRLLIAPILLAMPLAGCVSEPSAEALRAPNPMEPCGELPAWEHDPSYDPRVKVRTTQGEFIMTIFYNAVPGTATNFLRLMVDGFYNGTRVHQVAPGSAIFMGDPKSRDDSARPEWGYGGPGYFIPDEFHQFIRFDQGGRVSMSSSGPGTAGSQFTIALQPIEELNDQRTIFAHVTEGLDAVARISRTPTWAPGQAPEGREYLTGQPRENIEILRMEILDGLKRPLEAPVGLAAAGIDCTLMAQPGGTTAAAVLLRNTGQRLLNTTWAADAPDGVTVDLWNRGDNFAMPAGQTSVLAFNITLPSDADQVVPVDIRFRSAFGDARTNITLHVEPGEVGARPDRGDVLRVDYVGMLDDGRIFDSSEAAAFEGTFDTMRERPRALEPMRCRLLPTGTECASVVEGESSTYGGVVGGFRRAIQDGGVNVGSLTRANPDDAFGGSEYGPHNLGGRTVYFWAVVRRVGQ